MSELDHIRIAKPCPASWSEMAGDDKVRHCTHCNLNVYNLTAMTRAEAERLLAGRSGRLCLRHYRRADGRIMTSDCPIGARTARKRRIIMTGGLLAFLVNIVLASQPAIEGGGWTTGDATVATSPPGEVIGKVALPHGPEASPPTEHGAWTTGAMAAPSSGHGVH